MSWATKYAFWCLYLYSMNSARCGIFGLFFTLSAALQGQITENRHQIGVNGTQFFKQFIARDSGAFRENNPYLLTYRYHGKRFNYRVGLGGGYGFSDDDNGENQFKREVRNYDYAFRFGVDKTRALSKRFYLYYGVDFFSKVSSRESSTFPYGSQFVQKTVVSQYQRSTGLSGVLTFEFRITEKMTLFTEAGLNWSKHSNWDAVENPDFPDSSVSNSSDGGSMSYTVPLSLFFSFFL